MAGGALSVPLANNLDKASIKVVSLCIWKNRSGYLRFRPSRKKPSWAECKVMISWSSETEIEWFVTRAGEDDKRGVS